MRGAATAVLVALVFIAAPTSSGAQGLGTIAGVVKDTSGAVLPGVTVEVTSPALIEKIRTTVTDGAGQYTVPALPVGTYVATFTLPGFNTVRREGIEISASFTAPVNADMRVGQVEETITVSGEAPVVDIQSSTTTRTVTAEVIRAVPNGRTMYNLAAMYTGVVLSGTQDVGGTNVLSPGPQLSAHGGRPGDEVQMLDGVKVGNLMSSSGRTGFALSPLLWDQVDVVLSGQSGDAPTLGVQTNALTRAGGNVFSGTFLMDGSATSLQSSNLTDRLSAATPNLSEIEPWGLTRTGGAKQLFDINGGLGGPLKRDRIWFWGTGRYTANSTYIAGHYFPVDARARVREADLSNPMVDYQYLWDATLRLTYALTPKMRLTNFYDYQHKWFTYYTIAANLSAEATPRIDWPRYFAQATWTYTATNRVLFEAGYLFHKADNNTRARSGEVLGVRNVETGGTFGGVAVPPMTYGAPGNITAQSPQRIYTGRAAMTYATGTHNAKLGMDFQGGHKVDKTTNYSDDYQYRTTNYVLNQVTIFAPQGERRYKLDYNMGLFAQDRWTMNRLTMNGALRLEFQKESNEAYTTPWPSRYLNAAPLSFPQTDVLSWKDINPRFGVSYDVFGTGKTAFKASAGRGSAQEGVNTATTLHPANALVTSTARTVNETTYAVGDPRRLNGVADCDLANPQANGECGPWLTAGFGDQRAIAVQDRKGLYGWNVRPSNWEVSGGVQHELMPRWSVEMMYYRRIYGGFLVTDNTANIAADFTKFTVAVPDDRRLENAGTPLTVFDINPVLRTGLPFNTTTEVITLSSDYGKQQEHWQGFDVSTNARLAGGTTLQGGVTFGQTMTDNCEVVEKVPEALGSNPLEYCHNVSAWGPQYKMLAVYEFPWNIRISGNFYSRPGTSIQAGVIYTGAQMAAALGRPFSAGAAGQKTVNVMVPDTTLGDRLNQFDLRFSRIFRIAANSLDANIDIYNAFNSDAALGYTTAYSGVNGGSWVRPTSIIQGRIVKFGIRWDF